MSGADFYAEPFAYLFERYKASERRGVWHFTPADWAIFADVMFAAGSTLNLNQHHRVGDQVLGLDCTVNEQFTSPPELVCRP